MANDFLWRTFHRLIAETSFDFKRFLHDQFVLKQRLVGIVGARGVGKTTFMLQFIKEHFYQKKEAFYVSADNVYFSENRLLDFVDQLFQVEGVRYFFIDEIHRYPNWNQELKNIYDSFPSVSVVFSGSSSIDLVQGSYDLSRRAKLWQLPGLSFREYLNLKLGKHLPVFTLEQLLRDAQQLSAQLSGVPRLLQHFEEYLLFGYYPIVFQEEEVYEILNTVIDKVVYEDVAEFYNLKTGNLHHFKRILNFLATIPPGKVNANNLAKRLGVDNKTAENYLFILSQTGLVSLLAVQAHGAQLLSKPAKAYLGNTTLLAAINAFLSEPLDKGTLRELAFFQMLRDVGLCPVYPKQGDFQLGKSVFEIGGKNKTAQQLREAEGDRYVVKDDLLVGRKREIPLYLFGFLY